MIIYILIGATIVGVILYFFAKTGIEINFDRKYWVPTWKLIVLFFLGLIVGLWLPW